MKEKLQKHHNNCYNEQRKQTLIIVKALVKRCCVSTRCARVMVIRPLNVKSYYNDDITCLVLKEYADFFHQDLCALLSL